MKDHLIIHPKDNLGVALKDLAKGQLVDLSTTKVILQDPIKAKHKFTLTDLEEGSSVIQYGVSVGKINQSLKAGSCITTGNTVHQTDGIRKWRPGYEWTKPNIERFKQRTFMGYPRSNGQVGTANHWIVIPLVFCENQNLLTLREVFLKELGYCDHLHYQNQLRHLMQLHQQGCDADALSHHPLNLNDSTPKKIKPYFENISGIKFLTHSLGCGGTETDAIALCKLLAGYIHHPNTAGATILSLGCQKAQISLLQEQMNQLTPALDKTVIILEQQNLGSEQALIEKAIQQTFAAMIKANEAKRVPSTLDKLVIGVECGGSDGFSGISANPCIGQVSDLICSLGGCAVLSEFPELCGVENELIYRCENETIANSFIDLMQRYETKAMASGSSLSSNPSPGNIKDGLITDAIKSAGAAKKGGTSTIVDVQDYPGHITKAGLNLLCTPGNDVESTTALAGAGCNLILFSTGLGTPTGNPLTPVIKISTNSQLAQKMSDVIDYNAGKILSEDVDLIQAGEELFELCIKVASGQIKTKAELLGQDDFIPWKRGVSL